MGNGYLVSRIRVTRFRRYWGSMYIVSKYPRLIRLEKPKLIN